MQERFSKTLLLAKRALDLQGQRFFLSSGTALGARRNGKFIEYTNDIDFGIFVNDFDTGLFESMRGQGFSHVYSAGSLECAYQNQFFHKKHRVAVEIHTYYEDQDLLWYATRGSICNCMEHRYCVWKFPKFDLTPMTFIGEEFLIPHPVETFLSTKYGPDWEIPKDISYRRGILSHYHNQSAKYSLKNIVLTMLEIPIIFLQRRKYRRMFQ